MCNRVGSGSSDHRRAIEGAWIGEEGASSKGSGLGFLQGLDPANHSMRAERPWCWNPEGEGGEKHLNHATSQIVQAQW